MNQEKFKKSKDLAGLLKDTTAEQDNNIAVIVLLFDFVQDAKQKYGVIMEDGKFTPDETLIVLDVMLRLKPLYKQIMEHAESLLNDFTPEENQQIKEIIQKIYIVPETKKEFFDDVYHVVEAIKIVVCKSVTGKYK